jgi:hypothetical protein
VGIGDRAGVEQPRREGPKQAEWFVDLVGFEPLGGIDREAIGVSPELIAPRVPEAEEAGGDHTGADGP